jgi:hypothetical protein
MQEKLGRAWLPGASEARRKQGWGSAAPHSVFRTAIDPKKTLEIASA